MKLLSTVLWLFSFILINLPSLRTDDTIDKKKNETWNNIHTQTKYMLRLRKTDWNVDIRISYGL